MSELWSAFVDLVFVAMTGLAGVFGGNLALAILAISFAVRLALLPWMVRLAVRGHESRKKMEGLRPELERLRAKHAAEPERLAQETFALYRRHGIEPLPEGVLMNALVQLPIFSAIYSAIQRGLSSGGSFLWVKDLARPDVWLIALVASLAAVPAALQPDAALNLKIFSAAISAGITVFILWKLGAGLALYWGASSSIGLVQAVIVRQRVRRARGSPG